MITVTEGLTYQELFCLIRKLANGSRCGIIISQDFLDIGDELIMEIPNTFIWRPYLERGRKGNPIDFTVMRTIAQRYGESIQWVELVRIGGEGLGIPEAIPIIVSDTVGREMLEDKEHSCSFVPERCLCLHATARISLNQQDGLRVSFSKLSGYQGYDREERELEVSNSAQVAGLYINSLQSTGNTLFVPIDISLATSIEISKSLKGKEVHHVVLENLLSRPKSTRYAGIWLFVTDSLSKEQIQILEQYKKMFSDERITLVDI